MATKPFQGNHRTNFRIKIRLRKVLILLPNASVMLFRAYYLIPGTRLTSQNICGKVYVFGE